MNETYVIAYYGNCRNRGAQYLTAWDEQGDAEWGGKPYVFASEAEAKRVWWDVLGAPPNVRVQASGLRANVSDTVKAIAIEAARAAFSA